ncbi:hypothetical protein PM8797T_08734 [Gimesia maris DSM 8797]|nr:hypothetical protein PM8797T_08734 [Gimesia maris DSM 8797]
MKRNDSLARSELTAAKKDSLN